MPIPEGEQKLVLDTHIWVWLMEAAPELKSGVRRQIEACTARTRHRGRQHATARRIPWRSS
jgi:hypothetical protein